MTKLGAHIRKKREEQGLLLRQLASRLDMDAPMLSKIERGVRHIRRDKLAKLGKLLREDNNALLTLWLADKVYATIKDEEVGFDALRVAEEAMQYQIKPSKSNTP